MAVVFGCLCLQQSPPPAWLWPVLAAGVAGFVDCVLSSLDPEPGGRTGGNDKTTGEQNGIAMHAFEMCLF